MVSRKPGQLTDLPPRNFSSGARPPPRASKEPAENFALVPGFGKIIHGVRANLKLDQEKFAKKIQTRLSRLQKWEAEKGEPTIQEAKEFERMFQVKLLKRVEQEDESLTIEDMQKFKKASGVTMGDFIKFKKKSK